MDNKDGFKPFSVISGGKDGSTTEENGLPLDNYVITDIDDEDFCAQGFLVFTPYHVVIMRDLGQGALPICGVPLNRVKVFGLDEEFHEEELPL